jgi:hypothetical protein
MDIAWYDGIGLIGVLLILLAYLLLQIDRIEEEQIGYSVMNAVGAALVLVSLWFEFNLSAFVMEALWLAVSFIGIAKWWRARRARAAAQP